MNRNPAFQRALVLHHQGRYADAERDLMQVLSADPHDAAAHAVLALCLAEREQFDPAEREADAAVGLAPDLPLAHFARARVLYDRNRYASAEEAVREAIRLDAYDADYFALLAMTYFDRRRWADALAAAEQGLQVDPEHAGCNNLRAMALVKQGRRDEAGATIDAALRRDPENAVTHANQGWALLHRGEHVKAMEHFREALRLEPTNEWARQGIVEALKARNIIYRWMLMYFLWMGRLSGRAQWGFIIGGMIGVRVLRSAARNNPGLAPFVMPVIAAYMVFVVLTWLADPLFDLLLRLNRFGRLVLSKRQIMASNVIGGLFLGAILAGGAALALRDMRFGYLAMGLALLSMPVAGAFKVPEGWPRVAMAVGCIGLAAVGAAAVALMFVGQRTGDLPSGRGSAAALREGLQVVFVLGILVAQIGVNALGSVRPTR